MVQIIENRAEVEGVIKSVSKHPKLEGYQQLKIQLEKSHTVENFPNLAKNDEGKAIIVNVKAGQLKEKQFEKGKLLKAVVRKATPVEYFLQ